MYAWNPRKIYKKIWKILIKSIYKKSTLFLIYFKNYRDCGYTCNPRKFEIPALWFPRKVPVNPWKHLQCRHILLQLPPPTYFHSFLFNNVCIHSQFSEFNLTSQNSFILGRYLKTLTIQLADKTKNTFLLQLCIQLNNWY